MTNKRKHVLHISILALVFGTLLALATAFDLQVSHILADGNLTAGRYHSVNLLCNIVEIGGAWPIWTAAVFAGTVLTVCFGRKGGAGKAGGIFFFCLSALMAALLLRDGLKYASRICEREEILNAAGSRVAVPVFGIAVAALVLKLSGRWIERNLDRLLPLALAVLCSCLCFFLVELIKTPMGRMRYRGLYFLGDESYYTPWYRVSGARKLLEGSGLPRDCFKSFPSGHTFSAGMSYILIMLPDVFPRMGSRKGKILSYLIPIAYTGFVGICRITAGAHFFSDVLVGGTLAYLAVQIFRHVFLLRRRRG